MLKHVIVVEGYFRETVYINKVEGITSEKAEELAIEEVAGSIRGVDVDPDSFEVLDHEVMWVEAE
jgi:hypothetical protein